MSIGTVAAVFGLGLLVWSAALIPRGVISDRHMWLFTAAFFVLVLLLLAAADGTAYSAMWRKW